MQLYRLWVCVSFNLEFTNHGENREKLNFNPDLHLSLLPGVCSYITNSQPHFCELDIMCTCSKLSYKISC